MLDKAPGAGRPMPFRSAQNPGDVPQPPPHQAFIANTNDYGWHNTDYSAAIAAQAQLPPGFYHGNQLAQPPPMASPYYDPYMANPLPPQPYAATAPGAGWPMPFRSAQNPGDVPQPPPHQASIANTNDYGWHNTDYYAAIAAQAQLPPGFYHGNQMAQPPPMASLYNPRMANPLPPQPYAATGYAVPLPAAAPGNGYYYPYRFFIDAPYLVSTREELSNPIIIERGIPISNQENTLYASQNYRRDAQARVVIPKYGANAQAGVVPIYPAYSNNAYSIGPRPNNRETINPIYYAGQFNYYDALVAPTYPPNGAAPTNAANSIAARYGNRFPNNAMNYGNHSRMGATFPKTNKMQKPFVAGPVRRKTCSYNERGAQGMTQRYCSAVVTKPHAGTRYMQRRHEVAKPKARKQRSPKRFLQTCIGSQPSQRPNGQKNVVGDSGY